MESEVIASASGKGSLKNDVLFCVLQEEVSRNVGGFDLVIQKNLPYYCFEEWTA